MTAPSHSSKNLISIPALLVALHDVVLAALAFELSVWVRYLSYGAPQEFGFLWQGTVVFTGVAAVSFWAFGLYRGIWYYASFNDIVAILKAVTIATLVFLPIMFAMNRLDALPRSVLVINWLLLLVMLSGPRFLYRLLKDGNLASVFERHDPSRIPVLVAGISDAADTFIRETKRSRHSPYRIVGLIDRSAGRVGRDVRGVRVLGTLSDLGDVVDKLARRYRKPQRLIIASDRIRGSEVRDLLDAAERNGMTLARLPRITDFQRDDATLGDGASGNGRIRPRPVDIEDLLGRSQRVLDRDAIAAFIGGRRVLVTGAGGTIGSELCRQIAALGPAQLALVDNSEYALYHIDLELAEDRPTLARTAILADVRAPTRMRAVFAEQRPNLVFHAAAYKHVPLSEANPCETIATNVGGTRTVAELCGSGGVDAMVLISTDKAVNPTSVMGASKRVAEAIGQAMALASDTTSYATVRFGNVLGSTGSVVPLFERQLARGRPLTVTHEDATRYFMTTREAVELVLQAAAGANDEAYRGKIFVLDMGEPVRISDLAEQMIRLAGLEPGGDGKIEYVGLRPGEKLHEELFHDRERVDPTSMDGILLAAPRVIESELLLPQVDRLLDAARAGSSEEAQRLLRLVVPEYASPGRRGRAATRAPHEHSRVHRRNRDAG